MRYHQSTLYGRKPSGEIVPIFVGMRADCLWYADKAIRKGYIWRPAYIVNVRWKKSS